MRARHGAMLLLMLAACGRRDQPAPAPAPAAASPAPALAAWTWHPLGGLAVIEGEVAEPTELILEGRSIREHRFAEPGPVRWELFRPPVGESAVLRSAEGRELARFTFSVAPAKPQPAAARQPEPPRLPVPRPVPAPPAPKALAQVRPPSPPPVAPVPRPRAEVRPPSPPVQPRVAAPRPQPPVPAAPKAQAQLPPPRPPVQVQPALPVPEPPPPTTRAGSQPSHPPLAPIPGRRAAALPSVSVVPREAPHRAAKGLPVLLDPVVPRPKPEPPPPAVPPPGPVQAGPLPAWPGMGEALNLTRGPQGQKRLLLSFDGGSSAEVATEVLDLLKARGIHTTLFLTGAFIQRFPALVRRMAAEGHELGNHTMNHPHFAPGMKRDPAWTRERIQRELLEADSALVRLLGRPMDPYWRAPFGEHTAEIRRWAEELGYRHVGWSEGADTLDWATPKERRLYRSGEAIVARLQQRLGRDGDGLIVLMHLGSGRTEGDRPTDGLGAFMDRARKEGWTFVPASAFLRDLGKPAWDSQRRLALLRGSNAPAR